MLNCLLTFIIFIELVTATIEFPNCTVEHNSARAWTVDCSSLNLDDFPYHLSQHPVRNLTFVNNNLNSSVSFGVWKNLEYLNVAFNKISHISNGTFFGLRRLTYLNISYNEISSLNVDTFENLPFLKVLDISGNHYFGSESKSLEEILSSHLNESLRNLYMSDLNVHKLNENFFGSSGDLSLLDLSNNYLTSLPTFPKSLRILNISNNSLTSLPFHPFHLAQDIKTFISENSKNLSEIQSDAFHRMQDLRYVSFRGCSSLEHIYYGTFYSNHKLEYLSLADCNFKTLPISLKAIFLRIKAVDLQNNPWHCNVAIKWFFLLKPPTGLTSEWRCALPSDVLVLDFYGPKRHHEILKIILGTLVILVFVFFGMGIFFAYEMERKRKLAHPYIPLGRGPQFSSPIYISTVV